MTLRAAVERLPLARPFRIARGTRTERRIGIRQEDAVDEAASDRYGAARKVDARHDGAVLEWRAGFRIDHAVSRREHMARPDHRCRTDDVVNPGDDGGKRVVRLVRLFEKRFRPDAG